MAGLTFNAVDEIYRNQLKEINDLNWERFKAALQAEGASIRGDLRTEMANMRADLIEWMFLFWLGHAGLTLGLAFFGPR
jgi:hypothetical protein